MIELSEGTTMSHDPIHRGSNILRRDDVIVNSLEPALSSLEVGLCVCSHPAAQNHSEPPNRELLAFLRARITDCLIAFAGLVSKQWGFVRSIPLGISFLGHDNHLRFGVTNTEPWPFLTASVRCRSSFNRIDLLNRE